MIFVSIRARREIAEVAEWWLQNRHKAPTAFEEDLSDAFGLIERAPHIGTPVRSRIRLLRRILLPRARYHLYYRDTAAGVEVVALWHTSRRPPRL